MAKVHAGKPIIGIAGGIGSGKSLAARLLGEAGCRVIDSDAQVAEVYRQPEVLAQLRAWWGEEGVGADGEVNRRGIAKRAFGDPRELARLEGLVHPRVEALRDAEMERAANDASVKAYVWDTPLLFEKGLNRRCDAVVFVESPREARLARVRSGRGWDEAELPRRENLQMPLDKKREMSDYVVRNVSGVDQIRIQVCEVLSRILAQLNQRH